MAANEPDPTRPPPALVRPFVGQPHTVSAGATPTAPPPTPTARAIRPYLLTGGRAAPTHHEFEIEAQVWTTPMGETALPGYRLEERDILVLCRHPLAVAEVASRLGLHLGVTRVLVGDLIANGHLSARRPYVGMHRNIGIIERVINGLQAIG